MSTTVGLLLEARSVSVLSRGARGGEDAVITVAWSPDAPDDVVEDLRTHLAAGGGAPRGLVLVVGLAFLESAIPELPPIGEEARRAVLWRDADRYFPIADPAAIACVDAVAMAMPAPRLARWVQAFATLAPIQAIVTAPQLVPAAIGDSPGRQGIGLAAGDGERGVVTLEHGRLVSVRRIPASDARSDDNGSAHHDPTPLSAAELLRRAPDWADAPLTSQLLDAPLAATLRGARRRRRGASVALAVAALALLVASIDHQRSARLAALDARITALAAEAEPARRALARREQAAAELTLLREAETRRQSPDAPLAVLAQLTRILPRDAFVQRLEWDGQVWRVEGTADNAPRLVPIIDADAHFRDVRIAAASQRFLDAGRPRESFAIRFRMRPTTGGTDGAQ